MSAVRHGPARWPRCRSTRSDRAAGRFRDGTADAAFAGMELRIAWTRRRAAARQHRFLVAAHYLEGVQYDALAEALDLPIGTVKTHLYRAKRRLRELLEG